jgi:hypothetical protein
MAEPAGALLALWNDVTPELDAQYNEWHAVEHVPERLTVPGILWARRHGRIGGGVMPRYLTLYGLRDAQVLDSAPYQRLLREPTPMSRRMRPELRNVSRWVCALHEDAGADEGDRMAVQVLSSNVDDVLSARQALGRAPGIVGRLCAQRLPSVDPLPWLGAGQDRGIEGDWLLCATMRACDEMAPVIAAWALYERLPVG